MLLGNVVSTKIASGLWKNVNIVMVAKEDKNSGGTAKVNAFFDRSIDGIQER